MKIRQNLTKLGQKMCLSSLYFKGAAAPLKSDTDVYSDTLFIVRFKRCGERVKDLKIDVYCICLHLKYLRKWCLLQQFNKINHSI